MSTASSPSRPLHRRIRLDWQRIRNLAYGWRVRVRCPGCGNVVEVVMQGYTVIHHCDPTKYQWGDILRAVKLRWVRKTNYPND